MLDGESLPDQASALLSAGFDTPALRELAGLTRPTLSEAAPVLDRTLRELEVSAATPNDVILVALDYAERILSGTVPPELGAYRIGSLWRDWDGGDDLGAFYGLWAQWDDVGVDRQALESDIRVCARDPTRSLSG
jgi:hypothetical protein